MNICSNNHDEICYEGRYCPVCEYKNHLEETIYDLDKSQDEIAHLNQRIEDLLKEIELLHKGE
jgi:hypothetical protein